MLRGGGDAPGYEEGELQLEEGEAPPFDEFGYGYGNGHGGGGGGDEFFDPDAFTHIDEKLQRMLGHFRKRYEGEISFKNLGSQYGEHGSFLPTYSRSPLAFPQFWSPTDPSNRVSASRSYLPMETAQKNNFVTTGLDSSRKIEYSRTSNESSGISSQQMLNTAVNGSEQRARKIRIKVNSAKSLPRSTAAIYSGLGLDISPASSMENSQDAGAGAPLPEVSPDESPRTIFEIMTSHSIPGGLLLSPLTGNILELREMPKAELHDDKAELHRDWGDRTSASLDNKDQIANDINSCEKKDRVPDLKSAKRRVNNPSAANEGTRHKLQDISDISDDTGSNFLRTIIKTDHSVEKSGKSMNEISDQLKGTKTLKGHIVEKNEVSNKDRSMYHGFSGKIRYDSDEYNDQPCTSSSHQQNILLEEVKENLVHVKEDLSQFESKEMGSLFTGNDDGNSSGMIKGKKKKISSSQTALSGKKLKVKAQKQLNDDIARKSYCEDEDHAVGHGIDLSNLYKRDRSVKLENKFISSGETANKSDGVNGVDYKIPPLFDNKSDSLPSVCRNVTTESSSIVPTVPAPFVINEQWVCCDKCEKWRLLPQGVNPDDLPKKWRCSMQSWLPGMNSCRITEDETTRALRAPDMVPASENYIQNGGHGNAMSGIGTTTAPAFEGNIQSDTLGKLKSYHDGANVANNLDMSDVPKPSKKQYATMNRKPDGGDCFPELKEKRKQAGSSGEIIGKDQPDPMKSSVGVDQDNLRASKKMKKESNGPLEHYPTEFKISKSSPSANETLKNRQKHHGISPGMRKYGSSASGMHSLGEDQGFSDVDAKKSDTENSVLLDLSIKKRKSKQRLPDQHGLDPRPRSTAANCTMKQTFGEANVVKKKPRPGLKLSKTDSTATHARGTVAGVDDDDMLSAEKECLSEQRQENTCFQYPEKTTRRITGHAQTSAAATSSSSKVSNSHKSKAEFQETRASPVESVSSSPLRTFDKNALDQRKCYSSAVAVNVHSQESEKKGSSRSKRNCDLVSGSDQAKAHANGDMGHHVQKDRHWLKDKQNLKNACLVNKDSEPNIKNVRLNPEQKVNSGALTLHDNSDHKHPVSRQNGKMPRDLNSNRSDHTNSTFGNITPDKGNIQHNNLKINPSTAKASKQQESLNNATNGDSSYQAKQIGKAVKNLETRKEVTLIGDASNQTNASVLLKEARDLKHLSKRLKEKGDDFESTSMCFEAGLKFLHVASLCEAPNIDGSKQGDSIQAMKLYSETGNLCGFCAHEFERLKKMANAALAYKCVEVAYMKAAFFKHPGAIKDRHALQAASLMVPPAESPSSSASDVDNLNNQSTVAKVVSARGVYSPQIASNPISRNNHQLMGLLSYADDINNAFDGTRKSQNSFSAYCSGVGKNQVAGVPLVREVLDFSFHNVKGLLQLIRHSLESINRESVK